VRVADEAGEPIAAADVSVRPARTDNLMTAQLARRSGTSDANGRCTLRGLERTTVVVEAATAGRVAAETTVDLAAHDPRDVVELVLAGGGVVTGVVTDLAGAPIADARVAHHPDPRVPIVGDVVSQLGLDYFARVAATGVRTDADGRFRLTGLA